MKRVYTYMLIVVLLFLVSCEGNLLDDIQDEQIQGQINENGDEEQVLRILFYDNERRFMDLYGYDLLEQFPQLTLEIVYIPKLIGLYPEDEDTEEEQEIDIKSIMNNHKIDIIFPAFYYDDWVEDDLFLALDSYIKEPNFQADQIQPSLLESFKRNGQIYGLSPTFVSEALFYNKDLFDQYKVEYPVNRMDWWQVITLAQIFQPFDEYGIHMSNNFDIVERISRTHEIDLIDEEGNKLLLKNNVELLEVLERVIPFLKDGSIYISSSMGGNSFLEGKSAMMIGSNIDIEYIKSEAEFAWDVVTEPIYANQPNESSSISPDFPMSIYKYSENIEKAWDIISFLNSDEYASKLVNRDNFELVARKAHLKENNEINMTAFYTLQPSSKTKAYTSASLFYLTFEKLAEEVMEKTLDNYYSVVEGIEELQLMGQEVLDEYNRNKKIKRIINN